MDLLEVMWEDKRLLESWHHEHIDYRCLLILEQNILFNRKMMERR
jgi:hypothetical protein